MRHIVLLVTVALVMVAMMLAMVIPAFAQASENSGCVGQAFSSAATSRTPGAVGSTVSDFATERPAGSVGQDVTMTTQFPREDCPELAEN